MPAKLRTQPHSFLIRLGLLFVYPAVLLSVLYVSLFLYGNSRHFRELVFDRVTREIPGTLTIADIRLDPALAGVQIHGLSVVHPDGIERIRVERIVTRFDIISLIQGELSISSVELDSPRIWMSISEKGAFEMLEPFAEATRSDPRDEGGPPPNMSFPEITIRDGTFLIQTPQLSLLLEEMQATDMSFRVRNGEIMIEADIRSPRGRLVILPEMLGLVNPRATSALRSYRAQRISEPWEAVQSDLPLAYGREPGALALAIRDFSLEDFEMAAPRIGFESLDLVLDGDQVRLGGWMMPSADKNLGLEYALDVEMDLAADSTVVAYFARGAIAAAGPEPGGRAELHLEGSMAAIQGQLYVEMTDLEANGFLVDRLRLTASTEAGGPFVLSGDGLIAEVGDGMIQVKGTFDPTDGTYDFGLWIDQLPSQWVIDPLADGLDPALVSGWIDSSPSRYLAGVGAGVRLSGDLDAKSFSSFVINRFADPVREARPALADIQFEHLHWTVATGSSLPFGVVTITGSAVLRPDGRLDLAGLGDEIDLEVEMGRDSLAVRGTIDMLTSSIDHLRVVGDTRSIAELISSDDLSGRAVATIRLSGPFSEPEIDIDRLNLFGLSVAGLRIGRLLTSFTLGEGGVIPQLNHGQAILEEVEFGDYYADRIEVDYALIDDWLRLERVELDTDFGAVTVSGRVRIFRNGVPEPDPELELEIDAVSLDLSGVLPGQPIAGTVGVRATVRGTVSRPRVDGWLGLDEAYVFEEWIEQARATFAYSRSGVDVTDIWVLTEGGELRGELHLGRNGELISAVLNGGGFQLANLQHLSDLGIPIDGLPSIHLTFAPPTDDDDDRLGHSEFRPNPGRPDVEGSLIVRGLTVQGNDYGALAITVDTYGDSIEAVGQLMRDVSTRISVPFEASRPIEVGAFFDRLPILGLAPTLETIIERGEARDGFISAEIYLEPAGTRINAQLEIGDFWVETADRRFETARPILMNYWTNPEAGDDEPAYSLNIVDFSFGSEGEYVSLRGDITDGRELNLLLDGQLPVSLATLSDAIADATGVASVNLRIGGTLDAPVPEGQIVFGESRIAPRGLGDEVTIRGGTIEIEVDEYGQVVIIPADNPIEGEVFGGSFSLSGIIQLEDFSPTGLQLEFPLNNLTYRVPGQLSVTLDSRDANLYAYDITDPETFYLSGNIDLQEAIYFQDFAGLGGAVTSTVTGIFSREVERYNEPIWRRVPLLEHLQFDLGITARDSVFLRNTMFDAEIDIELQIDVTLTGTLKEPNLEGEVRVIDGVVNYQNRRYEIRECSLTFDGQISDTGVPMPIIEECSAVATIENRSTRRQTSDLDDDDDDGPADSLEQQDYTIEVSLSGDLVNGAPELTFASIAGPRVDQRDIISLIFFGRTVDELTTSTDDNAQFDLLFSGLVNLLENELESFAVDDLMLIVGSEGTEIAATERVGRRLVIDVGATLGSEAESAQSVTGQVTLLDWLILDFFEESNQENDMEVGGRLRLRLELD
jgi:hypothetical protein